MQDKPRVFASAWDCDLTVFENRLIEKNINFSWFYHESDDDTSFVDGFVYEFDTEEDKIEAVNVLNDL